MFNYKNKIMSDNPCTASLRCNQGNSIVICSYPINGKILDFFIRNG